MFEILVNKTLVMNVHGLIDLLSFKEKPFGRYINHVEINYIHYI